MGPELRCGCLLKGLRIGLDVDPGQTWQTSKELEVVLAPFIPLPNSSLRRLSIDTLITEDCSIDRRCRTAYAGVQVGTVGQIRPSTWVPSDDGWYFYLLHRPHRGN